MKTKYTRHVETRQVIFLILGIAVFISVSFWSPLFQSHHVNLTMEERPNFVIIMTDDQDVVLHGMVYMMHTKKLLADNGVTLTNAFVCSPLCCPSRSSFLTGQYVHNHYAVNNSLSGQCNGQRWRDGPEKRTFAAHLHNAGYRTFYAGKYLNQYGHPAAGGLSHVPPGWDWWLGLRGNSRYYNYSLSINGSKETFGHNPEKDYLTNVIRRNALQFISQHSAQPFLMVLAPPAPHAPFTPEPKYEANFSSLRAPRTPNFNIKVGKEKHWLLRLGVQPLPENVVAGVDKVFQARLRTLLSVDDMVRDVVRSLETLNILDNTFVILTSDNGYHLGQFSQPLDKREPYETDVRVPLLIRGPDLNRGHILTYPTTNIDLAPTLLDIAGLPVPKYMDGNSLKDVLYSSKTNAVEDYTKVKGLNVVSAQHLRRTVLIEHSGEGMVSNPGCEGLPVGLSGCNPNFACKCEDSWNNTYACLRQLSPRDDYLFCRWNDEERFEEAYNLTKDPWQLNNTAKHISPSLHRKLCNLLHNLKRCRGPRCSELARFVL